MKKIGTSLEIDRGVRAAVKEPKTHGLLSGETMTIAWSLWHEDPKTQQSPLDLAIEFTPDPKGQTFTIEARVYVDAIALARSAQDPKGWNALLVEAARMVVRDAATRDARLGMSAPGGAA